MIKAIDYRGDPRFELAHIGNRNSGRYRRGSGDRPYQHDGHFRRSVNYVPYTGTSDLRIDTYDRVPRVSLARGVSSPYYTTTTTSTSTASPYDFSNIRTYSTNIPSSGSSRSSSTARAEEYKRRLNRYVNADGTLTAAGQARFDAEKRANARKKKDDRVKDENVLNDPNKWIRDDLQGYSNIIGESNKMVGEAKRALNAKMSKRDAKRLKRMNLSNKTDQELKAEIDRYLLEQRYLDVFNPKVQPEIKKGQKFLLNTLETAGVVLTLAGSAASIVKTIHEIRD